MVFRASAQMQARALFPQQPAESPQGQSPAPCPWPMNEPLPPPTCPSKYNPAASSLPTGIAVMCDSHVGCSFHRDPKVVEKPREAPSADRLTSTTASKSVQVNGTTTVGARGTGPEESSSFSDQLIVSSLIWWAFPAVCGVLPVQDTLDMC